MTSNYFMYNGYAIWDNYDPSAEKYYCEITNTKGETVHETNSYLWVDSAILVAKDWVDEETKQ